MPLVRKTTEQVRAFRLPVAQKRRLVRMTDAEITTAAESDPDNPPLNESELARLRRVGRPPLPAQDRKTSLTLRLKPAVIESFKAGGPGWQTRMGEVLERAAARPPREVTVRAEARPPRGATGSAKGRMKRARRKG
jgi:uncharacterized protein (DUF4415 family)